MKTKYPIEIVDLTYQKDHTTPKQLQLFQEYGANPENFRLFLILIRRRETEKIKDGNKSFEVKVR